MSEKGNQSFRNFINFRKGYKGEIKRRADNEAALVDGQRPISGNAWKLFEGGVDEYDASFDKILEAIGFSSFRQWMKERRAIGLTTHILDVMGGNASFLRDLSINPARPGEIDPDFDSSLVITLTDERKNSPSLIKDDQEKGISIIAGDITAGATWSNVTQWMEANRVSSFDLVVCRGICALKLIPTLLYRKILEEFYLRTSNKKGIIISQISHEAHDEQIDRWGELLNDISGINSYVLRSRYSSERPRGLNISYHDLGGDYPAIGIVKTPEAPNSVSQVLTKDNINN